MNAQDQRHQADDSARRPRSGLPYEVEALRRILAITRAEATLEESRRLIREGAWQRGLEAARRALEIFRRSGDADGKARTFLEIGEAQLLFGDYELAQVSFLDAARLFRKLAREDGVALAHLKLGTLALYMYRPQEAREHLQAALTSFRSQGDLKRAEVTTQLLRLADEYEAAQSLEAR